MDKFRRHFIRTMIFGTVGISGCLGNGPGTNEGETPVNTTHKTPTTAIDARSITNSRTKKTTSGQESLESQFPPPDAPDIQIENHTGRRVSGSIIAVRNVDEVELLNEEFTIPVGSVSGDGTTPEIGMIRYPDVIEEEPATVTISTEEGHEAQAEFSDEQNDKQLRVKIHDDSIEIQRVAYTYP